MKTRVLRWLSRSHILALALAPICAHARSDAPDAAQHAFDQTRLELQQQGFKTDLTNFDLSASPDQQALESVLKSTIPDRNAGPGFLDHPSLLEPTSNNTVVVVWQQAVLRRQNATYPDRSWDLTWDDLRQAVNARQPELGAARAVIQSDSGPVQFNLNAADGNVMLLPHLAMLKDLTLTLNDAAMLAMHDGDRNEAWSWLMAATRLVTAWKVEPVEISHRIRFVDADFVFDATWQLLQAGGWSDDQLARLQHQWESADFLSTLPDIMAFKRACSLASLEQATLAPNRIREMPGMLPLAPPGGQYEDEKRMLLFYRDREIEYDNAVQAASWMQMRQMPAVTNELFFQPKYRYGGTFGMVLNQQEMRKRLQERFERQPTSVLAHAAEAETERRIIITALALERYRDKYGAYPDTLQALAPEFLKSVPLDFMNGQPLHYHVSQDGRFLLYSVGLDCVDNGGKVYTPPTDEDREAMVMNPDQPIPQSDIVWPLPASSFQTVALRTQQSNKFAQQMAAVEERGREAEREGERLRQQTIKDWLALKPPFITNEPVIQGTPIGRILQNTNTAGTTPLSLDDLLSLRKIDTTNESDIATYELPIRYDAVKDKGELRLLVDGEGGGEAQDWQRATNGDSFLEWDTSYDAPGQHAIRAQLFYHGGWPETELDGPVIGYYSTNVVQFFEGSSFFTDKGATLYAKTAEPHAIYNIEIKTEDGKHIKTFTGTTTNGIIDVEWDLRDEQGNTMTNSQFESIYNVTLPDSGRTQTIK